MSTPEPSSWCPPTPEPAPGQNRRQLVASAEPASGLCHLGMRPLLLTGLLRQVLLRHFASPENIADPDMRAAIWQDTPATGIVIESVHRWRGDLVGKRPAILIKRNAYRNMRIGINDRSALDPQGFEHYTTLWVGSHTLFCIQQKGAACEILATEVQQELTQFGPVLRQRLNLMRLQVTEVEAISEVEEATQNFMVPITVGWAYQEAWKLTAQEPPLQGIHLSISARDV